MGSQPNYMKRFAFICIPTVFVIACLLFGFQDSIKTMGGGFVLAAVAVVSFGILTWYAFTHCGDFRYFAVRTALVLDVLLLIFLIFMLGHARQEMDYRRLQQATGLLLHLPRAGLSAMA